MHGEGGEGWEVEFSGSLVSIPSLIKKKKWKYKKRKSSKRTVRRKKKKTRKKNRNNQKQNQKKITHPSNPKASSLLS